ncbi:hypothetical protein PAXINDRAFT_14179 [Paxillus involutus ATCC 200175]|uniref:DUF6533 domain-containing protein n=1 Tax=Paxillus involutus ATCC 200175 TaxID=664439 RepID=A0A0C9TBK3_PAXIN|nr:hypothetical protein PAXINDRAFT_14179 [Paxillus involutus ATCC 200175]
MGLCGGPDRFNSSTGGTYSWALSLIVQDPAPSTPPERFHPTTSRLAGERKFFRWIHYRFCSPVIVSKVTFIWSRRGWSVGKALFAPTRYIPFILIPLTLFSTFSTNINLDTCDGLLYFLVFLEVVAITLSEVIFGLRAYAMWNRNRAVLVIYCCVATAYIAAFAFILQAFLPSVTYGEAPLAIIAGCYKTGGSTIVFASFVVIMLAEAVTVALTLYRAYHYFRHTPNALVQNMTRDGIFYCVSMFSMSVANVLLIFLVPVQYGDMIAVFKLYVVSISVLFVFDYFYQLEDEVTFIWSRRGWGIGKALFVPTRYIPFTIIPITLFSTFAANLDAQTCEALLYIIVVLETAAITLSEVAFGLRAYAMWNRNRAVLVICCCVATAYVVALAFIFRSFLPSVTYGKAPFTIISGCYETGASSVLFASFVIVILPEGVTTALILYRALRYFRHTPNVLIQKMTRDGVFYCVTMFCMSVTNVLVICLFPIQGARVLDTYQAVMHTILATRMQIHLRKVDQHTYLMDPFAEESLPPMSFTTSTFLADI